MKIQLHYLNISDKLTPYLSDLDKTINQTANKINEILSLNNVDVVVSENPSEVVPELGVGGYTPRSDLIFLSLEMQSLVDKSSLLDNLRKTLIHEFHHTRRWENPGYGETLFEAMVTEGLADHFVTELTNNPFPWATAFSEIQLQEIKKLAEKELNSATYNHGEWFLGLNPKHLPKWSGYALGYKIVGDYLAKHSETKPSTLYASKTSDFTL